jgi:hypothetical protein
MSALETLDLNGTQVANVEPLKGLTARRELNLNGTQPHITRRRSLDLEPRTVM